MGSVAKNGLKQYLVQLQQHPLRTKAITAGVLSAISDIASQKLTGIQKLQLRRLLLKVIVGFGEGENVRYTPILRPLLRADTLFPEDIDLVNKLLGVVYLGPFGHYFHILLDKLFKGKKDPSTVGKKVLVEQLTSSPWNNLLFMIYYGSIIEGRPWNQVKSKIKKEFPTVQYAAWTFWPVIGWINHQHVPLQFRVIVQSAVACCWGIFLSVRAAKAVTLTPAIKG